MGVPVLLGPPRRVTEALHEAVASGGGTVVDAAEDAEVVVWLTSSPDGIADHLHDGVRWVQLSSAGIGKWADEPFFRPDRSWTSAAGAFADTVAEHALALLLAGTRQLHELVRRREWDKPETRVVTGSRVAIVGAGGIGRSLMRLLAPLRVEVLAVNRSGEPVEGATETYASDRLDAVWPAADAFVLAAPATSETHHLVDAAALAAMPAHAWVVNVGRGELVDTGALVEALAQERIAGAALDVTDPEPLPPAHPLWREPRAIITPHSANPRPALEAALAERITENLRRYREGRPLLGQVDFDAGY